MTYVPKEDMYLKQYQARDIWDNRHTYISETFKGWVQRGNVLGSGMSYPKGTVDAFNHSKIQSVKQDNVIEINTGKNLYKFITFYMFPPEFFRNFSKILARWKFVKVSIWKNFATAIFVCGCSACFVNNIATLCSKTMNHCSNSLQVVVLTAKKRKDHLNWILL